MHMRLAGGWQAIIKRRICVLPVGERSLADERGSGEISGEDIEKSEFIALGLLEKGEGYGGSYMF